MHRFRVWAPRARRVDLSAGDRRARMQPDGDGWWQLDDPSAEPGTRYGFALDGREPRPDPRSLSQPEGVLAPSQVVDHGAYRWRDADWHHRPLEGALIYELHIGTFSPQGTFASAIEKLPHLVSLGVNTVEVMPIAEFSGDHGWGYDGVDLYAPHHAYGGPDGFKEFVDACHAAGLAVLLDVVYNHLGPIGNFLGEFGPYFSDVHHTMWGAALNFDGEGSDEVRRFVIDNALMWVRDYHVDGLRLDAVNAIVDSSTVHILEQLATEVDGTALLIAETGVNDPRMVRPRDDGGYGLDAVWADDWHHAVHTALTGEHTGYYAPFDSLGKTGKALRQGWVRGQKPDGVPPQALVIAAQNHDQVGNRAQGERLCALVDTGRARAAAALLLTSPFTPLLFQGEEWAASSPFQYFTDHREPEVARRVSAGRRSEFASFGWTDRVPDPQDPATFNRSKLRWEELDEPQHRDMLDWYRNLIALRRRLPAPPAVVGQGVDVSVDEAERRITFSRDGVRVLVNLGSPATVSVEPRKASPT
ncbi:MAG TPA: malto-oligosyltrehalose trehalohydrolase [Candidatus Dormibacteraeota bacterium]|nr:malto-oligosyltrehalose trehalohydrolase [Candidatus Dormibacteraeota bacterium]